MKLLKGLFVTTVALVALLLVVGLFLPDSAHVERSIRTTASPQAVYTVVSGFQRFNEWSPWFDLDPHAKYSYSGPAFGVGARMSWSSDQKNVGSGSQEIVALVPGRSVRTRLQFGSQGPAYSTLEIEPDGTGSRIRWSFDTSFEGYFLARYFGLLFDKYIGADYEKGLGRLKALAERAPTTAAPAATQVAP